MVVQSIVCGLAALPVAAVWEPMLAWTTGRPIAQAIAMSFAVVPSDALFAIALMFASAAATRLTGWRTQPNARMRLADLDWPLLNWVRYMVATHIVRQFAGTLFRGTRIWSAYLRLNGARVGRRVCVNSLGVSDHTLLELGDDVVIGGDVHLSRLSRLRHAPGGASCAGATPTAYRHRASRRLYKGSRIRRWSGSGRRMRSNPPKWRGRMKRRSRPCGPSGSTRLPRRRTAGGWQGFVKLGWACRTRRPPYWSGLGPNMPRRCSRGPASAS